MYVRMHICNPNNPCRGNGTLPDEFMENCMVKEDPARQVEDCTSMAYNSRLLMSTSNHGYIYISRMMAEKNNDA
jgi:hypothetical protein